MQHQLCGVQRILASVAPTLAQALALGVLLMACSGGGGGGGGVQSDSLVITSPAENTSFAAGDTISFAGNAVLAADGGALASNLVWWADLHHGSHTHPFVPQTPGAAGSATVPVRGETADNIFYRFHLRGTDRSGQTVETTRDIQPRKVQLSLATVPAGLRVTLEGQPLSTPAAVTGVVGMERDLGAPEQVLGGRRYRFSAWSDGGGAVHTISTPGSNSSYTATFVDAGPAPNQAPTVQLVAPVDGAIASVGAAVTLSASAADSDGSITRVSFYDGITLIGEASGAPFNIAWTPITTGTHSLSAIATDNANLSAVSAAVTVTVNSASGDNQPPLATLTAPANLSTGLSGTITLAATASDNVAVAGVEFQIDGAPIGAEDTSAPYRASLNAAGYPAGQHVLRARARDSSGNVSAWASATVNFGGNRAVPQGFTKTDDWVGNICCATAFTQSPDGRFFIALQAGELRVVKDGALLDTPFHLFTTDPNGERGLLGVALHPEFALNGFVYIYYTTPDGGTHNRISRLVANGDVSIGGETVLVDFPPLSSATNHNGGGLRFGPDGKLYVGVGENANAALAQDLSSPLGKMLRFNDDGSIPGDNPFFDTQAGLAQAVWAYGLRNPFTFAFQPGTGRMHINDVGQGQWEEIDLGARGANYGWPLSEGPDGVEAGITGPLFAYAHEAAAPPGSGPGGFLTGFAIAGGAFYPGVGPFPPAYRGQYYFADYALNFVARMDMANGNAVYAFAQLSDNPVDMRVGLDGALYVLTRGSVARIAAP